MLFFDRDPPETRSGNAFDNLEIPPLLPLASRIIEVCRVRVARTIVSLGRSLDRQ